MRTAESELAGSERDTMLAHFVSRIINLSRSTPGPASTRAAPRGKSRPRSPSCSSSIPAFAAFSTATHSPERSIKRRAL